ncbi:DNA internalization-related competence protein ComEC/Rec2 [candidate division KSB1 bacterium]|nr:DNA internalization-related competence protein ComEC/Rec2 [candidate division KSB1 bacterium]
MDTPFPRFRFRRVPLLPFVASVVSGIVLALFVDISSTATGLGFIVTACAAAVASAIRSLRTIGLLLALTTVAVFACDRTGHLLLRSERQLLNRRSESVPPVAITGRIFALVPATGGRTRVDLNSIRLLDSAGCAYSTPLHLSWWAADSATIALRLGDVITSSGRLLSNRRQIKSSTHSLIHALSAQSAGSWVPDGDTVSVQAAAHGTWESVIDRSQVWVRQRFDSALSPDGAALCKALVIGDQSDFSEEFTGKLRATGLSHIFALSGMNVAVVATLFWLVAGFLPHKPRLLVVLLLIIFYLELGGAPASLLRATIMLSIYMAGQLMSRRVEIANIILGAAFVELLWRPLDLLTPGFLLSYLAVAGVALVYPAVRRAVFDILRLKPPRWTRPILELALLTVCAQLATAPLAAYYFGTFPLAGALGNLLAIPGFALLQICSFAVLTLPGPLSWLATPFAGAADLLAALLGGFVRLLGQARFAVANVSGLSVAEAGFWIIGLTAIAYGLAYRRTYVAGVAGLVLLSVAIWRPVLWSNAALCKVSFIDVENGDAILIQTAERNVLVDTGPRWGSWSAARRILPVMREHGISRLDAIVLTHPESDHIGGAADLIQGTVVEQLLTNGDSSSSVTYALLQIAAKAAGVSQRSIGAGDVIPFDDRVVMTVLSPDSALLAARIRPNEAALVIRLSAGDCSVLLTADIDSVVERELLAHSELLDVDLLKVAHHGSGSSSCIAFLDACSPQVAVISVGGRNVYGHPSPSTIERIRRSQIELHCTMNDGTMSYETDGSSWRRIESRAERWSRMWHVAA